MNKQPITMDKYYDLINNKIENLQSLTKRNPLLFSQVNQLDKQFLCFMDMLVTRMGQLSKIINSKTHIIKEKELEIEILKEQITELTIPKVENNKKSVLPKLFNKAESKFFENSFGKNSPASNFINSFLKD